MGCDERADKCTYGGSPLLRITMLTEAGYCGRVYWTDVTVKRSFSNPTIAKDKIFMSSILLPASTIKVSGQLTGWQLFPAATGSSEFELQIWRPSKILTEASFQNGLSSEVLELIHSKRVQVEGRSYELVSFSENDRIDVQAGDIPAWRSLGGGDYSLMYT